MAITNLKKISVSFFESVYGVAKTVSLFEILGWLTNNHFKAVSILHDTLEHLTPLSPEWKEAKDKGKAMLPCWTPSAIIREGEHRSDGNILKMSGIMAFDFDLKDQTDKERFLREFKSSMAKFPWVFYAGYSVSKSGFFALVLTDTTDPFRFKPTYAAIATEFEQQGWITDSQASSLSNFRFVSYDPEPYVYPDVVTYKSVEPQKANSDMASHSAKKPYVAPSFEVHTLEEEYEKIEELILTKGNSEWSYSRENWIKVGFAFVNTFGEKGRALYHQYSALCPEKYNAAKCDRKYSELLRSSRGKFTIGTFYYLCGLV